jgi:hypothetical protein
VASATLNQYESTSATIGEAGSATASSATAVPLSTKPSSQRAASTSFPVRIERIDTTKAEHPSLVMPSRTSAALSMYRKCQSVSG